MRDRPRRHAERTAPGPGVEDQEIGAPAAPAPAAAFYGGADAYNGFRRRRQWQRGIVPDGERLRLGRATTTARQAEILNTSLSLASAISGRWSASPLRRSAACAHSTGRHGVLCRQRGDMVPEMRPAALPSTIRSDFFLTYGEFARVQVR